MRIHFFAAALAVSLFSSATSFAVTFDWTNTGSGTFSNAANWTPVGGPPGPADTARFALGTASSNVTFSASASVGALTQSSGNVTFFLNGFTLQAPLVNFSGMGADNATATLHILNGSFQPAGFTVGGNTGSNATLTLDANTVMTVNTGVFQVGNNGTGTLIVQNGATLTTNADTRLGTNSSGAGAVTINGGGSSWNIPFNPLRIGVNNSGAVSIINGGTVTANALTVGENTNATGILTVVGANSTFTTGGTSNVGGASAATPATSGVLNIGAGATVSLNGTTNLRTTATVNMTGGTWNLSSFNYAPGAVVNWSAGTINFANAAEVTADKLNLLLAGGGTLGANRTLSAASGTLDLSTNLALAGGTINVPDLTIDANLALGAFSSVTATNSISIESGKTVQIENFGSMSAGSLILNNGGNLLLNGPTATVGTFMANNFGVIQGTGRFAGGLNNGTGGTIRAQTGDHIIIEETGLTNPGLIELAGGTVEYTRTLSNLGNGTIMGRGVYRGGTETPGSNGLSNIGVVALSGGTTDFYGDVNNSGAGRIVASGGSVVTFFDDVTHNGLEIRTNSGSRTVFFGAVTGSGPFTGTGVVEVNGDLKPGNSPTTLTFGGDVEFSTLAGLEIEIAGTEPGSRYDQVQVAGALSLGGDLHVKLIDGFMPAAGNSFNILDWGTLTGTFSSITLDPLTGGKIWDTSQLYTSGVISVQSPIIPGDFDSDGDVDGVDFIIWQDNFPQTSGATLVTGDADGDGDVDGADFVVWQTNFPYSPSPATTPVPEPPAIFGALLAAAFGLVLASNSSRKQGQRR